MTAVPAASTVVRHRLGDVVVTLELPVDAPVLLVGVLPASRVDRIDSRWPRVTPLVEVSLAGESHVRHSHGTRHRNYDASSRLRYRSHRADATSLVVTQVDPATGLVVETTIESTAVATVAVTNRAANEGDAAITLEYLSGLVLAGFAEAADARVFDRLVVHTALMAWTAEYRWRADSLAGVGLVDAGIPHATSSTRTSFTVGATGGWSTGTHLPQGALEDPAAGLLWMWQVEHDGPWWAELNDTGPDVALSLSGPTYRQHHWSAELPTAGTFTGVTAVVAVVAGGFDEGVAALTAHRRARRRARSTGLPIIANDYMNCLMGDPSTEALLPLVDSAAELGADHFVIDAGWYADDAGWWSTVGAWEESTTRFPGGLVEVLDRIRERGMVPGLWLEPEVMGVDSDALVELEGDAFFERSGRRVAEQGRYHLDFRNPRVRSRLDGVVDRLVRDYGVGYLKLDYNINIGEGTDGRGESLGAGLLGHDRAYIDWLDGIRERHPDVLLENCASGGMRADQALGAATHLQSTSDQEDPVLNAAIAVAAPTALLPEQAGVWSYPQPHYSDDLNDFTLVQSLLCRVHLGGRHDRLDPAQRERVRRALAVHAGLADFLPVATPFWPLGTPGWSDDWLALGMREGDRSVLTVFRRGGRVTIDVPLADPADTVRILYPDDRGARVRRTAAGVRVTLPASPGSCAIEVKSAGGAA